MFFLKKIKLKCCFQAHHQNPLGDAEMDTYFLFYSVATFLAAFSCKLQKKKQIETKKILKNKIINYSRKLYSFLKYERNLY